MSAGHPGMKLAGLKSVAASIDAVVVAFTGEGSYAYRTWTVPRSEAAKPVPE